VFLLGLSWLSPVMLSTPDDSRGSPMPKKKPAVAFTSQPTKKPSISATRAAKRSSCRWISQLARTRTTSKTAQFAATRWRCT